MDTIRVDGNDVLAVYNAVKAARRRAIDGPRPILIEALTYRVGHHSTSDDSSAYRSKTEVSDWAKQDSPMNRFRKYLESKSLWSDEEEKAFRKSTRTEVLASFAAAEKLKKPAVEHLWTDVYAGETPWNLAEQKRELEDLMRKYPEHYDASGYAPSQ
ncbi:branched chain ketoacid dehydrogenase E1, alpha polypeptide, isoform CRA_b [Blyttiomyces helicus]|uniref:2-oxoisovalerate dehydrogenase subunit alpha n=1 Tax=Blyttiomyces helicus TaxID=388810 RepID=A0A4P9WHC4_9FUNG|nr:branched chain ketoacid dehydrogenase E1, alpha polypeptide, isoform CRA_b [Blyttiomyces helicus]|eukprot:RKO92231.1 branched chain ketoacid dehydrogenase E1, alpha polypeptide, isoform CRA_b [Blyttiomyces helicus]